MKVVIVGAGAVGCWFGGWLSKAGQDVTFVVRGERLTWLQQHPLELHDPEQTMQVEAKVVGDLAEIPQVDLVIWATKTLGTVQLPEIPPSAVMMTVQNSVEMPTLAMEKYGVDRVIPAVVRGFFTNSGLGQVTHDGGIQSLTFGSLHPETQPVVQALADSLNLTPIKPVVDPNILVDIWVKAMFVSTFGALGSAVDQPLGVVRTRYRDSLRNLMAEVELTARANNVELKETVVSDVLSFADQQAASATSSLQRDLKEQKDNELDAQVGGVLRMAARRGVTLPAFQLLYDVLSAR